MVNEIYSQEIYSKTKSIRVHAWGCHLLFWKREMVYSQNDNPIHQRNVGVSFSKRVTFPK